MNLPRVALIVFWILCGYIGWTMTGGLPSRAVGFGAILGLSVFYFLLIYPYHPKEIDEEMKDNMFLDNLLDKHPLLKGVCLAYVAVIFFGSFYVLFFNRTISYMLQDNGGTAFVLLIVPVLAVFALWHWKVFKSLGKVDV